MRRLFILIAVCMIGMVLPQGVFAAATVTVSDGTVTINTDKAGDLKAYLQSASEADKAAIRNASSIVFDGKFNKDDLEALKNAECCTQSTVDMAKAKFVKSNSSSGGNTYLFKSDNQMQNKSEGDCCIVGAMKYRSGSTNNTDFEWNVADYANGSTLVENENPQRFSSLQEAGDAPHDYNTVILVGGTDYVFRGGQWVSPSQTGGDEEYDYTQMSFSYWGTNVKTAITSNNVLSENDHLSSGIFSGCTNLENITLGSGAFDFKIGNASDFTKIKSIEVKKDVRQLGSLAQDGDGFFPSSSSLSTVTFEMGGTTPLKLGKNCFNTCTGIGSVTLPARTQLIEELAFGGTSETSILSEVKFNNEVSVDYPMVIKSKAFYNQYNITDVWVDIDPGVRPLVCEYEAFDFHTMDGQTYPANPMAVLHFNEAYWDYYAGDWKKGMTLTHEDLLTIRDGKGAVLEGQSVTKGTNSQLVNGTTAILGSQSNDLEKTGQIKDKQPANGWQQFARTSTGIDIIVTTGKYYRTYSTPSALVKPDWMKIYRVKEFNDGYNANDPNFNDVNSAEQAKAAMELATSGAKTEILNIKVTGNDGKEYVIIPEETGVIRVDERTSDALYYFLELERTSAGDVYKDEDNKSAYEYPYSEEGDKVNFMYPTKGTEATIGPVEKKDGMIAYRIFGLLKQTTSGVSPKFARALVGTKLGDHRAYLKLPAGVFHWKNEKVGTSQNATGDDVVVDENNTYAKISLLFDDDFEELNGGIATAIINSIEEDMYKNDSFYTLQGVKVAKPTTKGVYIHNGKKILIK